MEQKFISDCRYRVIESSSLIPILFREFIHVLVNGFSVIIIIIIVIIFFRRAFSECIELILLRLPKYLVFFYNLLLLFIIYYLFVIIIVVFGTRWWNKCYRQYIVASDSIAR